MSLEPIPEMMRHARSRQYAVGYFESWSIDSLYGVIDAAEQMKSPVIIGFNGEFLSRAGRIETERLALYGALGRAAAASANVPCGFIFNECAQDEWTRNAISLGFNLVMPADPGAARTDYTERVSTIARLAHANSVAVEAEIGELPSGVLGEEDRVGSETSVEDAKAFVAETGIDLLMSIFRSTARIASTLHGSPRSMPRSTCRSSCTAAPGSRRITLSGQFRLA
jgi:fructose/tagatose bisphosphate aldolase